MKTHYLLILVLLFINTSAREGMWMPQLLKQLNENDMKSMGMILNAEDLYSINKSSLKDAIVHFGGGCTGEVVSEKGLLLTNHHCGFSQIQAVSSIEKNYLKDGFWALNISEELHCQGLTVTFIREITDVTDVVLEGVDESNEDNRSALIKIKTDSIEKTVSGTLKGSVRHFYHGNKFYLFITEVYSDIRLVGAPPQSVGKFGGETDNWIWPRHTGDFAFFRIYANKDNQPAAFSKENVPYVPKKFLTINISGVKENDFVLVYGFPGRTNEYQLTPGLELIAEQTNPNRIAIREARIEVMREEMKANDTIRLKYSSKFSTLTNAYKKWQGQQVGFKKYKVLENKKIQENEFFSRMENNPATSGNKILLHRYDSVNKVAKPLNFAIDYFTDAFLGIELLSSTLSFRNLIELCDSSVIDNKKITDETQRLKKVLRGFYKNYDAGVDKKVCTTILNMAYANLDKKYFPEMIVEYGNTSSDFKKFSESLFRKSLLADSSRVIKFLEGFKCGDVKKIENDQAYKVALGFFAIQRKLQAEIAPMNKEMAQIQRKYMKNLLIMDTSGKFYPDANSTLRVSYGRAEGTIPVDGMHYKYFTTIDGIYDKSLIDNEDYTIPDRLKTLIEKKDYGRYAQNNTVPVAFIASAHTTGGNSGSPALNGKGELIGINYDTIWEGVLADFYYDEKVCRNICLDIRYALFITEKLGNAKNLIDEMKIVNE